MIAPAHTVDPVYNGIALLLALTELLFYLVYLRLEFNRELAAMRQRHSEERARLAEVVARYNYMLSQGYNMPWLLDELNHRNIEL